ncbi:MAG: ABC transporter ATP-binding protein [Euryarchaeota archaeon]|nr:ABC transporter ATP-binding protein [Euryarchaeota archaeon]
MVRAAVQTLKLTRTFGTKVAVDAVTLAVPEGQIYGYLGLNGAGKSTTIKMLTTLLRPTSGQAWVDGHDVQHDPMGVRKVVGFVGDEGGPDARPLWTGREYLRHFARLHRLASPKQEVENVMDLMGLEPAARRKPISTYSTGMKRRVEVGRAFLGRPRVMFLDEPTRGLDLPAKREMWDFFRHLARTEKVTMFLSSHEGNEIRYLCERLSVIVNGRLSFSGPAAQLGKDATTFEDSLIRLLRGTGPGPPAATARTFQWSRA